MPKVFFENDIYKSLTNKELLKKQEELEIKISKAETGLLPSDLVDSMLEMQKLIDKEVDERLDDGRMTEDELEEEL